MVSPYWRAALAPALLTGLAGPVSAADLTLRATVDGHDVKSDTTNSGGHVDVTTRGRFGAARTLTYILSCRAPN